MAPYDTSPCVACIGDTIRVCEESVQVVKEKTKIANSPHPLPPLPNGMD